MSGWVRLPGTLHRLTPRPGETETGEPRSMRDPKGPATGQVSREAATEGCEEGQSELLLLIFLEARDQVRWPHEGLPWPHSNLQESFSLCSSPPGTGLGGRRGWWGI